MKCYFCGKTSVMAGTRRKLRGKYNPVERKRKYPNLQWAKLPSKKRVMACTKCIKTIGKRK